MLKFNPMDTRVAVICKNNGSYLEFYRDFPGNSGELKVLQSLHYFYSSKKAYYRVADLETSYKIRFHEFMLVDGYEENPDSEAIVESVKLRMITT